MKYEIEKNLIVMVLSVMLILTASLACNKKKKEDILNNDTTNASNNNNNNNSTINNIDYTQSDNDTTSLNTLVSSLEYFSEDNVAIGENEEDVTEANLSTIKNRESDNNTFNTIFYNTTFINAKLPAHWFRRRNKVENKRIEITVNPEDSTAIVKVEREINADFIVDTTFDKKFNPGSKPINDLHTHYAKFKKLGKKVWQLTHISLWEKSLQDKESQMVFIKSVKVYKYDSSGNDSTLVWQADSSSQFFALNEIPELHPGDNIRVEAKVENNSDSPYVPKNFAFLHHSEIRRDLMEDTGIFSKKYTIGDKVGVHFAAIDILNSECLQNQSQDDYNSMVWGIPYRITSSGVNSDSTAIIALLGERDLFYPRRDIHEDNMPLLQTEPIWWRKYEEPAANFNILVDNKNDSTIEASAIVNVNWNLNGNLIVLDKEGAKYNNPITWKRIKKTIAEIALRRAELIKKDGQWQLIKFSPMQIIQRDEAKRTITIQKISILKNYDTIWQITSPMKLLTKTDIPKIIAGERVNIIVEVQNDDNNKKILLYLHHLGNVRIPFIEGINGVYSLELEAGKIQGINSVVIDAIEMDCLTNKLVPYNAAMWKIPYFIDKQK
ncbi:hypothetical protein HY745_03755 [Candidatus Desantisbacteria bacterium]|nr:hypothetical protein [Candidatus Desantisbacteria bacterium]